MKFCVIGLGRFGYQLAISLAEKDEEVLAVDRNEQIIAKIRDKVTQAVCINVVDDDSLRAIGIEDMDTVIVAMGEEFSQSILITALLKKHFQIKKIIARAVSRIHESILKLVGADEIVFPEKDLGIRLANNLSLSMLEFVQFSDKFAITEINVPKNFVGKTISELQLKKSRNIACIAIRKNDEIQLISPDYVLLEGDRLILAGEQVNLADFAEETQ
ncbi:TrkA family potassium uptake protein [Candidatus Dependentiae bacterium]|nr:TrkA family potassium uptake protein [Candidatus Dependentiae bacterium]